MQCCFVYKEKTKITKCFYFSNRSSVDLVDINQANLEISNLTSKVECPQDQKYYPLSRGVCLCEVEINVCLWLRLLSRSFLLC